MRRIALIIFAIAAAALAGGVYFYFHQQSASPAGVACTEEAMQCPDGSYVGRTGPNCAFAQCPAAASINTSTWKTYANAFGFSVQYPPTWQRSSDDMAAYILFGNPLNGTTTYTLEVSELDNPQNLSAADFVKQMLAEDAARDASNSQNGPAPQTEPQFKSQFGTTVGNYPGYELSGVFEFDHNAEQIYVQHNKQMLIFDFPVADENPNIASPAQNNAMAHAIAATLSLDVGTGKFCGGIAAFQCPSGYSCLLDGTYPDAGGTCVKK